MEKIVEELKNIVSFKDTTEPGDIVLLVGKEPQMLVYAKVTKIERDFTRKDEWWQLHLSILSIPLQNMVWTLRTPQMTGMEIFTMGGEERFVKAVNFELPITPEEDKPKEKPAGKITPFKRIK